MCENARFFSYCKIFQKNNFQSINLKSSTDCADVLKSRLRVESLFKWIDEREIRPTKLIAFITSFCATSFKEVGCNVECWPVS